MPAARKEAFNPQEQQLAALARALSHPARIAILRELAQRNTCICGEIVSALPLSQSTVSQHLHVLLEAGLIQGTVDGPRSCYCLNASVIKAVGKAFDHFFKTLSRLECC
ncbi:MAG: metalloregulator ArsR/SmtB family transcription factor [Saprospiraceae bacterium]|nr:metalloregulator ArsR/SmtB family transcription factor [Saprospiraceae bacterium]MDW8230588.1 metalloregulator ArsR/SmtB family transcription factor [Saprospiraceae bacterium]